MSAPQQSKQVDSEMSPAEEVLKEALRVRSTLQERVKQLIEPQRVKELLDPFIRQGLGEAIFSEEEFQSVFLPKISAVYRPQAIELLEKLGYKVTQAELPQPKVLWKPLQWNRVVRVRWE